jgi:pSer/pThr/pTyr-binding forkhead associated (FHA) protein
MARWRVTFELDTPLRDGSKRCVVELEDGERCIVGRSPTAPISVDIGRISREHLAYEVRDGQLFVEDLGSSNGSWLNAQRVTRSVVKLGDKVHAGRPVIVVTAMELVSA